MAESPQDVLVEIGDPDSIHQNTLFQTELSQVKLNQNQQGLFSLLDFTPCPVDELIRHSGLTADQVSSILMQLELQGLVVESIGGYQKLP